MEFILQVECTKRMGENTATKEYLNMTDVMAFRKKFGDHVTLSTIHYIVVIPNKYSASIVVPLEIAEKCPKFYTQSAVEAKINVSLEQFFVTSYISSISDDGMVKPYYRKVVWLDEKAILDLWAEQNYPDFIKVNEK